VNTIVNERRKLFATLLNTLAAGSVVTGVFAPAAAYLYGINSTTPYHWWLIGPAWLFVAGSLHSLAYFTLGKIVP